jgi:hypothetical protein
MSDSLGSWIAKLLVSHDTKYGADFGRVITVNRCCQVIDVSGLETTGATGATCATGPAFVQGCYGYDGHPVGHERSIGQQASAHSTAREPAEHAAVPHFP